MKSFINVQKTVPFFLACGLAAISLLATVIYLIFGMVSQTFETIVFFCLLLVTLLQAVSAIHEGKISDYLQIIAISLIGIAIGFFVRNSVGDFTEMLTPVGMYGNPENMPVRFFLVGLMIVDAILAIVVCFIGKRKAN